MTEMIERVARAMASQFGDVAVVMGAPLMGEYYRNAAITAIKALREPTDYMVNLGEHCADACYKIDHCGKGAEHIFKTMIDAALKGTEQ